jgi:predicted ester cyclase
LKNCLTGRNEQQSNPKPILSYYNQKHLTKMKTKQIPFLLLSLLLLVLLSCQRKETANYSTEYQLKKTIEDSNVEKARNLCEYLDAVQLDSFQMLLVPDAKLYFQSGDPASFDDMIPMVKMFYEAFPDYKHEIEDVIAADDKVVLRISYSGTFINPFFEMNPTGEKFNYKGIWITQFEDGKVINLWVIEDEMGLMAQLGA